MSPTQILLSVPTGWRLLPPLAVLVAGDKRWNDRYCRWEETTLIGKQAPKEFYYIRSIHAT